HLASFRWRAVLHRMALPIYLSSLLLGTMGLVTWMLLRHTTGLTVVPASLWLSLLTAVLMMFPASETVVALINRLISESIQPKHLPRLTLVNGIPLEHRVMVVIPSILTDNELTDKLVHRLQLHYLANPERNVQFALLTDWADADTAHDSS